MQLVGRRLVVALAAHGVGVIAILVGIGVAAGYRVAAGQPTRQIDVRAALREQKGRIAGSIGSPQIEQRPFLERFGHSVSRSPALSQLKWSGKPSPVSSAVTSVSGNPTTLVYEPTTFWTKHPARPWIA